MIHFVVILTGQLMKAVVCDRNIAEKTLIVAVCGYTKKFKRLSQPVSLQKEPDILYLLFGYCLLFLLLHHVTKACLKTLAF